MSSFLEVNDVHTYIAQFHILQGVTLDVGHGEILALLGRNGAGKTTTLKPIMGLTRPRSGSVAIEGEQIQGRETYDIAALGISLIKALYFTSALYAVFLVLATLGFLAWRKSWRSEPEPIPS